MELGEKLRRARLEAGLSQRQLCGDKLTRNMLSQIENGSARPSMDTLRYLAEQLGCSVSYFLEEEAVVSPNTQTMERCREAFDRGDYAAALAELAAFREPDPVYGREQRLMKVLCLLEVAELAIADRREPYARELLERAREAMEQVNYLLPQLRRRALLLESRLKGVSRTDLARQLPALDEELLLRAYAALESGETELAGHLLDAASDRQDPHWGLLRGQVWLRESAWEKAAQCFHLAEESFPRETAAFLERCYRELGDYRQAYNYACRERSFLGRM